MLTLPYITSLDIKTDGHIKEECSHFIVDEIPLYLPSGSGQHIYLLIKKVNLNTQDVIKSLCTLFSITDKDIGHAGLKDKRAITTQWLSLSLGANTNEDEVLEKINSNLIDVEVLQISKHTNKLKTGHLIANRFTVTLSDTCYSSYEMAQKVIEEVNILGLPNFYGEQRFGSKGDNAQKGRELLLGTRKVKKHWLAKMYLSAFQSELFNQWLIKRIEDNKYNKLIPGDLLQKNEGGRPFLFDQEKNHLEEFINHEICYTGPIFGAKFQGPESEAKTREDDIFSGTNISIENLSKMRLQGTRRAAIVFPGEIELSKKGSQLIVSFTLPAGSYATIFLREFTKNS